MRAVRAMVPIEVSRETARLALYGPGLDGAINTDSAQCVHAARQRGGAVRYGRGRYGHVPFGSHRERAGYGRSPLGRGPLGHERKMLSLAASREVEHGVFEYGAEARDRFGNVSASLATATLFVADAPEGVRGAEIGPLGAGFQVTIS